MIDQSAEPIRRKTEPRPSMAKRAQEGFAGLCRQMVRPRYFFFAFGTNGDDGALGFLIGLLEGDCGLTINRGKCAAVGTTPDACVLKPDWLPEPTSFKNDDGLLVETGARGIVICQNPIGEIPFVQNFLDHKFKSICSVIKKSFLTLSLKDQHVAFQALHHSFQTRADYWLSTNLLPPHIASQAERIDNSLKDMHVEMASFSLFTPLTDGSPFPSLTGDRVGLKVKDGGLGFRLLSGRRLFLNSTNFTLPQALDRADSNGTITPGLWNSLSWCLGAGSFDFENRNTCWSFLHESESTYGAERLASIARIKVDHASLCQTLGIDAGEDPVLAKPDECFGFGIQKLHRTITGTLKTLSAKVLKHRTECAKDDQRRVALESADVFSNSYPNQMNGRIRFSPAEAKTALQRKFGIPVSLLLKFEGEPIHTNGRSHKLRVDRWGRNVAAAPGVSGDHARTTHDSIVTFTVSLLKDNGIITRGGGFGSVNGVFRMAINQSNISPEDQRAVNGILPDLQIDGRPLPSIEGLNDDNKQSVVSLWVKTRRSLPNQNPLKAALEGSTPTSRKQQPH